MLKPDVEVRRIPAEIDFVQLAQDLTRLPKTALNAGAAEAAVIEASLVHFSLEIKSLCEQAGNFKSNHWPVSYPLDSVEEAVRAYRQGIFFRVQSSGGITDYSGGPIVDPAHRALYEKVYEITSLVESTAFYWGYHLAMGFAAGNCRSIFCPDERRCRALLKGQSCRNPYKSRPSLEALGIDAGAIVAELGWKPAKKGLTIPAGLVMIA